MGMDDRKRMISLRLREFLLVSEPEPVEIFASLVLILWGFWVASPWWDTFSAMTTYRAMQSDLPEALIGCVVAMVGALRIWLTLNNRYRPRLGLAILIGFFWGFNFGLTMAANPASVLAPVYLTLMVTSFWLAIRLAMRIHVA